LKQAEIIALQFDAAEIEVVSITLAVADRRCTESELAAWLRKYVAAG
jgi:hypothetical protein